MAHPKARKTAKKKPASKKKSTAVRKRPAVKRGVSSRRRRPVQEKAAIRSDAFAKAILDARSYRDDPESLRTLFQLASIKAASIPQASLNELGPYLHAMLRLIRAYARGEYREIARDTLLTIIAAISYLVDPFDLIPDEVPFLGFIDDATVIGFALSRTRNQLDEFMRWETSDI